MLKVQQMQTEKSKLSKSQKDVTLTDYDVTRGNVSDVKVTISTEQGPGLGYNITCNINFDF